MDDLFFEIKGGGNFIKFRIINPPQYHDPEDWALVDVAFQAKSFSGAYRTNIMIGHFFSFNDDFSTLYENLNGNACFNDKSGLDIYVNGDGLGHFTATVKASDLDEMSRLEYKIEFDQTFLPEMIAQLGQIVKKRPSGN